MTDKKKALLVVMDGLGDRQVSSLKDKTPLQAAKTPVLDRLAREGQTGLMDVIGPGITPGSDAAHLALFGYDPVSTYPGRGPLEASGAGLETKPGDVAFRSNFASVDEDLVVIDRRAGRAFTPDEQARLQAEIDGMEIDDVKVRFVTTVEHRGAMVLSGPGLYAEISDVDPHETGKRILTCEPLQPEAKKTAEIVNKLMLRIHERLQGLPLNDQRRERGLPPANAVLVRGPGRHGETPTLGERYGVKAAVIAGGALYIGTAEFVGMVHVPVEGQTGTIHTNFSNIAMKTVECIKGDYDFIFVHIKATDNASHDHNAEQKVLAIERTDEMIGEILKEVGDKIVLAVTGDHTTPVSLGEHTSDPVPVLLWTDFLRPDDTEKFSEVDAARGALHTIRGQDLLPILLGYAGYIGKFGA